MSEAEPSHRYNTRSQATAKVADKVISGRVTRVPKNPPPPPPPPQTPAPAPTLPPSSPGPLPSDSDVVMADDADEEDPLDDSVMLMDKKRLRYVNMEPRGRRRNVEVKTRVLRQDIKGQQERIKSLEEALDAQKEVSRRQQEAINALQVDVERFRASYNWHAVPFMRWFHQVWHATPAPPPPPPAAMPTMPPPPPPPPSGNDPTLPKTRKRSCSW